MCPQHVTLSGWPFYFSCACSIMAFLRWRKEMAEVICIVKEKFVCRLS